MRINRVNIITNDIAGLINLASSNQLKLEDYETYLKSYKLYSYEENELVKGIISYYEDEDLITLKHIAVHESYRHQGIGKKMIHFIKDKFANRKIKIETDIDAVNFYRSLGFHIVSLGEKYPGVERFEGTY